MDSANKLILGRDEVIVDIKHRESRGQIRTLTKRSGRKSFKSFNCPTKAPRNH